MTLRRLMSAGVLALLLWSSAAQAQRLTFRQYAQDQGLENLGMQCLTQDRSGFVLACSENGVFQYDGQSFDRFGGGQGLPRQGIVYDIESAPSGRRFVVFSDAVYVAQPVAGQPTGGRFVAVRKPAGPIELALTHQSVLLGDDLLLIERGLLSIVRETDQGPVLSGYFDADFLQAHPALRHVVSVASDTSGLWLGCGNGQVCHVGTGRGAGAGPAFEQFGDDAGLPPRDWTAFLHDRGGTLWIRSLDLIAFRPAGATRFTVDPVPGGPGRYAGHADRLVLALDPVGRIVTQGRTGLLVRDGDGWRARGMTEGVPEGQIVSIMVDREHSLWLAVRNQGVFRGVGVGEWENWTREDGLSDNVIWQMARSGYGPLWVATEGGADALRNGFQPGVPMPHLAGSGYAIAITPAGRVWRSTMDGVVSRFDPATGEVRQIDRLTPLDSLFSDGSGRLWLESHDGLYMLEHPDAAEPGTPMRVGGLHDRIRDMLEDTDGTLWMISERALVHRDAAGTLHTLLDTGHGLNIAPRALAFGADGSLWVGSGIAGIQRMKLNQAHDQVTSIEQIAMPVIGSNNILILHRDRRGWMWVGNDSGLDVWNGSVWHHVDEEDGLLSNDLDESSVLEDRDGSLWFGTGHGISHLLDPPAVLRSAPLHPVIISVQLGGGSLPASTVDWSEKPLSVRFGALDYRDEHALRFRYRLSGVDRGWVDTAERAARYPELPPGRLTFSVMAYDPLKRRSSEPISFTITVRPPWWRSWPFLIGGTLALVGLARALWRARIRYLMARQRQLEALVAVRTAEIERARAALFEQATRDSLTGLLNRPATMQEFDLAITQAAAGRRTLAVALVDLDHFKSVNDRFGHLGGDVVLREIAHRLQHALAPEERAGRYGGEELLLLLPMAGSADPHRARALRDAMVVDPVDVDAHHVHITCSIGVAWYRHGDTPEGLLRRADACLYRAKNEGRDRITVEPVG